MHNMGILTMAVLTATMAMAEVPQIIAHRGGSKEQDENTLLGFKNSYEKGVRGFETDVRLTLDHRVAVLHDDTLDRTTDGKGRVETKNAAELVPLRTKKTGQPLPFLDDLLDFVRSKPDAFIQVEIKCGKYSDADIATLCDASTKLVAERGVEKQVVFISFEPRAIKKIKELNPRQATCLVSDTSTADVIKAARALHAEYLSVQLGNLSRNFVRDAHKAGLKVTTWTISTPQDAQLAILLGTDYVTTDVPAQQLEQKTARP
jgi:glycerophosphoryl diester phosphodiesterase